MTPLNELLTVRHRSVRAVNLDEDLRDPEVLTGYAPGAHVIDALRRITAAMQEGARTRAFSITGPYGSGKSSFGHFLCSLFGPKGEAVHGAAARLLGEIDPQLAETTARERRRLGADRRGLILATVSAKREPISEALLRALHHGAERYWSGPGRKPDVLHELREAASKPTNGSERALRLFEELAATTPVLLIVDELGKNLEYASDREADGDLHLLQMLAERLSSRQPFAGGLLTLAHLAFEDYLLGTGDARRREWRKIHGRFEDIPFVANAAHSVSLVAEALCLGAPAKQHRAIANACAAAELGLREVSGETLVPSDVAGNAAATYPLHPSVALALPSLAANLAQHDRSLVSFLTSDAPHALPRFLAREKCSTEAVPFFRPADLYDYFFEDGAATVLSGAEGELAREVGGRINDAGQLEEFERRVLKTIGLLNLIGGSGQLQASAGIIEEAMVGPHGSDHEREGVRQTIQRLSERSIVTYRDFAGEYRIWRGSDFDTSAQILAAREHLLATAESHEQLLQIIEDARPLRPEVARRHSQKKHLLRYLECRYAAAAPADPEISAAGADGLIVYVLSDRPAPKSLPSKTVSGEPLVVVWSSQGQQVRDIALDFAAASAVLSGAPELGRDPVARREMRHRVAALQGILADRLDRAFSPRQSALQVFSGGKRMKLKGRAEFSRLLTSLCDKRYPKTPVIRNEMVNRRELTSQGAKARRVLLERMFTNEQAPQLSIEGFGPERAMYEAVLHHTGLHQERDDGRWGFAPPPADSELAAVWAHLGQMLDRAVDQPLGVDAIYEELLAPPFGMKDGAVPLLLAAALQHRSDEIFLYQEGSFQPVIEPAHIERLLKSPERFSLKRASMVGLRARVFEQLREIIVADGRPGPDRMRNQTTLEVVRPLITFANELPEYTRNTSRLSETAQRVCSALLSAREPDELLFTSLPEACGIEPFSTGEPSAAEERQAANFVKKLRRALAELAAAHERRLDQIGDLLHTGFAVAGPRSALRENLRSRSRALLGQVIERTMRSFLTAASDESLDEREWLEAIAMSLSGKPPSSWTDRDVTVFEPLVAERARWFRRLELLWHETNQPQEEGFEARRITITAHDGREHSELVASDAATEKVVEEALSEALRKLEQALGRRAQDAILGALATRVLSNQTATTEDARLDEQAG